MNSLTFLAMAICLCGQLSIGTSNTQDAANFGFGVELILAKLEGLENRMIMLEKRLNNSLEAMLNSHCSPQPGRLDPIFPTEDTSGERFTSPNFPDRTSPFNNRPVARPRPPPSFDFADRMRDNSGTGHHSYSWNETITTYENGTPKTVVRTSSGPSWQESLNRRRPSGVDRTFP